MRKMKKAIYTYKGKAKNLLKDLQEKIKNEGK